MKEQENLASFEVAILCSNLANHEYLDISKDLDSDDDDDPYDPNSSKRKGAGPKISVKKSRW